MTSRFRPLEWLREHPWVADALLATGATAASVTSHILSSDNLDFETRDPSWWTSMLIAAASFPVLFRRMRPLTTAAVVIGIQVFCEILTISASTWIGVLIALYSVGAYSAGRRRTWFIAAAAVGIGVPLLLALGSGDIGLFEMISFYTMLTGALIVGDNVRRRREHMDDLAERAERAERERDLLARERVNEERARIARELHDIVAHSVSAIVIQSSAAQRSLDSDPSISRELLVSIEDTGRQAMHELRRVLGVLRDDDSDHAYGRTPQPSLANVDALVTANGDLPIKLTVDGDISRVSSGLGLSAYRILQEAITNVRRHAGTVSRIDITITTNDTGLGVVVDDDGRGAASIIRDDTVGYGILGMGERVAASAGKLRAGPRPGGGWRVAAHFPIGGS